MNDLKTFLFLILISLEGYGQVCFDPAVSYGVGSFPIEIVKADFNNDGFIDLACANQLSNTISVLTGTGTGSFSPQNAFTVGSQYLNSIITDDFNKDGNIDLAFNNHGADSIGLMLGLGNANFSPPTAYHVGASAVWLVSGDFDNNSNPDIATANQNGSITVLSGNGDGTMGVASNLNLTAWGLVHIAKNDFDLDGNLDLVASIGDSLYALMGNGNGTFSRLPAFYQLGKPYDIYAEDIDLDGKADLALSNTAHDSISVFYGTGSGNFGSQVFFPVGNLPYFLTWADLNGDANMDLIASGDTNEIFVLMGLGNRNFAPFDTLLVGFDPQAAITGDFNGDSRSDIAVVNGLSDDVSILLNCSTSKVEALSFNQAAKLYPNPAKNLLTVENAVNTRLEIADVTSSVLRREEIKTNRQTIDLSGLAEGIYFVSVQTRCGLSTQKIMILH